MKTHTLLACDFETYHKKDFETDGIDVRIVGNEVHIFENGLDTHRTPEVWPKCCGIVSYDLTKEHLENGTPMIDVVEDQEYCETSLDAFLCRITEFDSPVVYFHNLRFDEAFIINAVLLAGGKLELSNGWTVRCKSRTMGMQGRVYQVTYIFSCKRKRKTVQFRDSAKIYNQSLESLGKMVGLKKGKEALTPGMNAEIMEYCKQDCRILGRTMIGYFNMVRRETFGKKKLGYLTAASTAYNLWLQHCFDDLHMTEGDYQMKLPKEGHPYWMRQAYRGASPLLDKSLKWKKIEDVSVFDVNSMYPYQMKNAKLPWGLPEPVTGEELDAKNYWLKGYVWCAKVDIVAYTKKGYRPCFLLKSKNAEGETLENHLDGDYYITDVDLKLIAENYDITYFKIKEAWKYKACMGVPGLFVDRWYKRKAECKANGDKAGQQFAKLVLNALYGKFGSNDEFTAYDYILKEDGSLGTAEICQEERHGSGIVQKVGFYLPWAVWITANARYMISKAVNILGWEHVCYTDTDSLHVHGMTRAEAEQKLKEHGLGVGPTILGDFKYENECDIDGIYVRNKGYAHFHKDGSVEDIRMAGANDIPYCEISVETFNAKTRIWQTRGYHVKGGVLLLEHEVKLDRFNIHHQKKRKGFTPGENKGYDEWLMEEYWRELYKNNGNEDDMAYLEDKRHDEKDPNWKRKSEWKQHRDANRERYKEEKDKEREQQERDEYGKDE